MILDNHTDVEVEVLNPEEENIEFSIDQESLGIMFKGFSDTLYSDKIGSLIREVVSNAVDANIEAGNEKLPVEVSILEGTSFTSGSSYFEVKDYGIGMSPSRIKNIYSKYFASTKRKANTEIGGFGIGAKSPLSYVESFTIETTHNNVKYIYIVYRGEKAPTISLVSKEILEKKIESGTVVKIPIKNDSDIRKFKQSIQLQLRYFDNIYYDNCGISNDYEIIKGKNFKVVPGITSQLEISLGNVRYPLNLSIIDFKGSDYEGVNSSVLLDSDYDKSALPVALKFEVGDIPVSMSRETIEYTDDSISKIQQKIADTIKELAELYYNQNDKIKTIVEYVDSVGTTRDCKIRISEDKYIRTSTIKPSDQIFTPLSHLGSITIPLHNPFYIFYVSCMVQNGKVMTGKIGSNTIHTILKRGSKVYRLSGRLAKRKNLFIEEDVESPFYVVKMQEETHELKKGRQYLTSQLSAFAGETPEQFESRKNKVIEEYEKFILKELVKNSIKYDTVEVPEEWVKNYIENLRENRDEILSKETITVRHPILETENWSSSSTTRWRMNEYKGQAVSTMLHSGKIVVYGSQKEVDELERLASFLYTLQRRYSPYGEGHIAPGIYMCKIAEGNKKFFKGYENAITPEEFYKKYRNLIVRAYYGYYFNRKTNITRKIVDMFNRINSSGEYTHIVDSLNVAHDIGNRYNGYHNHVSNDSTLKVEQMVNDFVEKKGIEGAKGSIVWINKIKYDLKEIKSKIEFLLEHYSLLSHLNDTNYKPEELKLIQELISKTSFLNYNKYVRKQ